MEGTQSGRMSDAGQAQCRRKADAERRIAEAPRSMGAGGTQAYGRNSVRKLFAHRIKPFCSLRGTSSHSEFCAAHQTDLSDFATLKASLNFALRHRPRVKLPLAILGGISSNKYAPPIEL